MKRFMSILLVFAMIISFVPAMTTEAKAITENEVSAQLTQMMNQWVNKYWVNHSYFSLGQQCFEFAHYVFNTIFGRSKTVIGTGAGSSNSTCYKLNYVASDVITIGTLEPGYSWQAMKSLLESAKPGDFLQAKKNSGSPHSMIVVAVNAAENYIDVFDANATEELDNKIQRRRIYFTDFKSRKIGATLYRHNSYSAGPQPVDLGTNFYAYIINTAHWMHLTNDGNNVSLRRETGDGNQIWHFERLSDGSYKITSVQDGNCMEVCNFSTADGANVQTLGYNGNTAQQWYITGTSGSYVFRAKCANTVLDVSNGSSEEGTNIQMWTSNGTEAQHFSLWILSDRALSNAWINSSTNVIKAESGEITFNYGATNATHYTVCFDKRGVGRVRTVEMTCRTYTTTITNPGIYDVYVNCYNSSGSLETSKITVTVHEYVNLGDSFYAYIQHQSTGLYLTNQGDSIAGEDYSNSETQIWHFSRQSDGAYTISSVYDNACIDVWGESQEDGTVVYAYEGGYVGGKNQRFYICNLYGAYYLRPAHCTSNKMLDMSLTTHNLELWPAGEDWAPQEFDIHILPEFAETLPDDIGTNFYAYIDHQTTGLRLENQGSSISGQTPSEKDTQVWKFTHLDNGAYSILSAYNNACIDILGFGEENGTTVYAYEGGFKDGLNQQFFIYRAFDAYYFRPAHCMHAAMLDMSLNTHNVQLWGAGEDWEPQEFDIKTVEHCVEFDANGGMNSPEAQKKQYDQTIILSASIPERKGYSFDNWNTAIDGSGKKLYPGDSYSDNASVILYAQWVENCELNHNYTYKVANSPTLSTTGTLSGTCSKCGGTTTVTLPKLNATDYTYEVKTAATCEANGSARYTWKTTTYGSFYFDVTLNKTGHVEVTDAAVPATCVKTGLTEGKHCSVCGTVLVAQKETAALGHSYGAWVESKAATCTAKGQERRDCTRCDHYETRETAALGHSYSEKVTAPTCTAQGYTTHTCTKCGNSYKDTYTNALSHSYTYKVTKSPTASATGTLTGTCSGCSGTTTVTLPKLNTTDYTYEVKTAATCEANGSARYTWKTTTYGNFYFDVTLNKTGHVEVTDAAVPATCVKTGLTEGKHCSVCGTVLVAQKETAALGHSYGTWAESKAATCAAKGQEQRDCTRCDHYETREKAALGHSYSEKVTAPTCTEKGYTTYTCTRCGNSYTGNEKADLGHSYGTWKESKAATCTEKGQERRDCTRCDHYETREKAALGHSYSEKVTAPTCTEKGYTTYTCTRCGSSYTGNETAALGHSYGAWVESKAATCTAKGQERRDCTRCDHFETRETAIPSHRYSKKVTVPTCTEKGYTTYTCICGDNYRSDETAALGHVYHEAVTEPTCTEEGYTTYTCTRCDDSYTGAEKAALGHSYGVWTESKSATCTEKGQEERECTRCGHYKTRETATLGHDYSETVTAPTCTEKGYTTYTCTRCGDSYTSAEEDALGHAWDEGKVTTEPTEESEGIRTYECTRCGESRTETIPPKDPVHLHSFTETITDPTCTEAGYTTHTCSCGESYKDAYTDALKHSYADGLCVRCGAKDPDYEEPKPGHICPSEDFTDVPAFGNWAHNGIDYCVEHELMNGTGNGLFNPNGTVSRAQLVTILYRVAGSPEIEFKGTFADVANGKWYSKAIEWAAANGVVNGIGDGKFGPDQSITREQIATILYRYENQPAVSGSLDSFPDKGNVSGFAVNAMLWATGEKLITGVSSGGVTTLAPKVSATRAQIAAIIMRYLEA